jgi:hypothetical protein
LVEYYNFPVEKNKSGLHKTGSGLTGIPGYAIFLIK